jgi:hypothetical protein
MGVAMHDLNVARFGMSVQAQDDRVPGNCLDFASVHDSPVRVTAVLVGAEPYCCAKPAHLRWCGASESTIGGERRRVMVWLIGCLLI